VPSDDEALFYNPQHEQLYRPPQEILDAGDLGADASAYYFRPGRSFSRYGAEQIACQVEKGYSAIVSSVRSVPAFVTHPGNNIGLELPHWEVMGPGIDSC
jgi:hypothetical protein